MKKKILIKKNDHATAFGISGIFFIAAWVIHLFPETILNFYPDTISKILLAMSFLWLVGFDDRKDSGVTGFFSDLGIGLGSLIIFISFINADANWDINILFF